MSEKKTQSLLNVARGDYSSRVPVWFLRQAGRYLPEYRELRAKMSFLELCQSPKDAAEVTLQPLRRFDLDAAIIFSDILVPPAFMGQKLTFEKDHGPRLTPAIRSEEDFRKLSLLDPRKTDFLGEAIERTREKLLPHQTMIGFAGAPFTVATYMVEGQGSKNYVEVKKMMYQEPQLFRRLMDILVESTLKYLELQVAAGAEVLMLFDSWAAALSPQDYREFALGSLGKLIASLKKTKVPIIYYSGQGADRLDMAANLNANVLAIDWRTPLEKAAAAFPIQKPTIQGNLDPALLSFGTEETVAQRSWSCLEEAKRVGFTRHIFNVGHGVLPTTKPELIEAAIRTVREWEKIQ